MYKQTDSDKIDLNNYLLSYTSTNNVASKLEKSLIVSSKYTPPTWLILEISF